MRKLGSVFFFTCTLALAQEAGYRDLATGTVEHRRIESTTGSTSTGGIGYGDGVLMPHHSEALRLTLTQLEGADFKIGDTLIYDVKLENVSNEAVTIPWAQSPKDIEPRDSLSYEYQSAQLVPRLINSLGQVEILEPAFMYGSNKLTLRTLAPGQWVKVRAKSSLTLREPRDADVFLASEVRVGAVWSVDRVSFGVLNGHYHETFVPIGDENLSTNTLPIRLSAERVVPSGPSQK